jgi:hypothetical protein
MASTKTGTYVIADLLENQQTTVADLNEQELAAALNRELDAHNALTNDFVDGIADRVTDRIQMVGAGETTEFMEADELARVPTQKPAVGANFGIPMLKYDYATGWTQSYFEMASVADFARKSIQTQMADLANLLRQAKRAIYLSANYSIVDEYQTPAATLAVKRLANADSFAIPMGPNGQTFDTSTHTHYTAEASLSAAGLLAAVNTVREHFVGANLQIDINSADEAGVSALTGFKAFTEEGVQLGTGQVATQRLSGANSGNRAIGRFGEATVWVKPWAIDNYALVRVTTPGLRPLGYRQPVEARRRGLRLLANLNTHPLHADYFSRLFGFGVKNRVAAAVHYFANGTFADPTIS